MTPESPFRLCASSSTGALLTIGTSVRDPRSAERGVGVIRAIRETGDGGEVFVRWPDETFRWSPGRALMRVGKAAT